MSEIVWGCLFNSLMNYGLSLFIQVEPTEITVTFYSFYKFNDILGHTVFYSIHIENR